MRVNGSCDLINISSKLYVGVWLCGGQLSVFLSPHGQINKNSKYIIFNWLNSIFLNVLDTVFSLPLWFIKAVRSSQSSWKRSTPRLPDNCLCHRQDPRNTQQLLGKHLNKLNRNSKLVTRYNRSTWVAISTIQSTRLFWCTAWPFTRGSLY